MGFFSRIGRTAEVFGQGVVRGLAGGVAAVGDFAVDLGYNWTTRNAINVFRAEDNKLQSYDTRMADNAAEAVTWTEAQNDWERGVMTAGQVVGEVGGFVAVTVATGGVGGAAFGAARVGAGATRAASALSTGGSWAANTARVMNPAATHAALGVEGAFGAYRATQIYELDANAAEVAEELRSEAGQEALGEAAQQQEFLNDVLTRQGDELRQIIGEINEGGLGAEREATLRERIEEIRQDRDLVETLRSDGLDDDQREQYLQQLQDKYPAQQAAPEAAGIASPYTRAENSGQLSRAFANGGNVAVAGTEEAAPAPVQPQPKPLTQEIV